jgi:putative hydrolase of HD superfamily
MDIDRLKAQVSFITEIDKLKQVLRRTITIDQDRNENDAEHSWHTATMAFLLSEYAGEKEIDLLKVIKMMLIHDIVEIDAGDTYCYSDVDQQAKVERESRGANRIFGLLPGDQARDLHALWGEFEAQETAESRFAAALDRLQPLLLNFHTGGKTWKKHGVSKEQVLKRAGPIRDSSPVLWEYAERLIDEAARMGLLCR